MKLPMDRRNRTKPLKAQVTTMKIKLFGNKNQNKIYCTSCGREIEPFYYYCIHCGASTEDNPKCNSSRKDLEKMILGAKDNADRIREYTGKISNKEIAEGLGEFTDKLEQVLNDVHEKDEAQQIPYSLQSLLNLHLPRFRKVIEHYIRLQDNEIVKDGLEEIDRQLIVNTNNYCEALDSVIEQRYENDLTDVSIDLKVLDDVFPKDL